MDKTFDPAAVERRVADACATGVLTVLGLLVLLGAPSLARLARGAWRAAASLNGA